MEEGLFVQFNKIANSIVHSKSKEQRIPNSQSDANTKQIPENGCEVKTKCCKPGECLLESVAPAVKVKELQVNERIPPSITNQPTNFKCHSISLLSLNNYSVTVFVKPYRPFENI